MENSQDNRFGQLVQNLLSDPDVSRGISQTLSTILNPAQQRTDSKLELSNSDINRGISQTLSTILNPAQQRTDSKLVSSNPLQHLSTSAACNIGEIIGILNGTRKTQKESKERKILELRAMILHINALRSFKEKETLSFNPLRWQEECDYSLSFLEKDNLTSSFIDEKFNLNEYNPLPFYYPLRGYVRKETSINMEMSRAFLSREEMNTYLPHFFDHIVIDNEGLYQLSRFRPQLIEDTTALEREITTHLPQNISKMVVSYANNAGLILYFRAHPHHDDYDYLGVAFSSHPNDVYRLHGGPMVRAGLYFLHHHPLAIRQPDDLIVQLANKLDTTPFLAFGGSILLWIVKNADIEFRFDITGLVPLSTRSVHVDSGKKESIIEVGDLSQGNILIKEMLANAYIGDKLYLCNQDMIKLFIDVGLPLTQTWKEANAIPFERPSDRVRIWVSST